MLANAATSGIDRDSIERMTYSAVIFDLDGVISNTAGLHARAWKTVFDLMLNHIHGTGEYGALRPFDIEYDYREFVDGKSRYEGIISFLRSRQISLPEGPANDLSFGSVNGLSNVKNPFYRTLLELADDVIYDDSVRLIHRLNCNRTRIAVASSSKNCRFILHKFGLYNRFNYVIGGEDLERHALRSKPCSDIFDHVVRKLGVARERCIVIEDAPSGVKAAANASIGLVVGVERCGSKQLSDHGASCVVNSLDELELAFNEEGEIACSIRRS